MEMRGLKNIVENMGTETLHDIELPPEREDFTTRVEYARAYNDWYWRVTAWKVSACAAPGDASSA